MARTSLTMALHGVISPVIFAKVANPFHARSEHLTRAILLNDEVQRPLGDGINPGGVLTVWRETANPESGALIAAAALDVGRALAAGQPFPTRYPWRRRPSRLSVC